MKKMFLVDGSNHAFRVHFALPPMHSADGFPTRALYGFTTLFAKLLREHQPDYVVVSFDSGTTFRHELFADYKGHRPEMPEDLRMQWPFFADLVHAFGYKTLAIPGYEADDVLGTLAKAFGSPDLQVFLVTGDQDYFQLVDENIHVLDLMKDEEIGPKQVEEKFGVPPSQVVDVLGLAGDASDNIPGVPGVGEKTAVKYLQKFGSLEGVLAGAAEVGGKRGQALVDHAEAARLSAKLATICTTCDLGGLGLGDLQPLGLQEDTLRELMDRWDFGKVARKLLPERKTVATDAYRLVSLSADLDAVEQELRRAGRCWLHLAPDVAGAPCAAAIAWGGSEAAVVDLAIPEARARVQAWLADASLQKSAHDIKRELRVAADLGWAFAGVGGDVMLLDYVLAAHERSHSLEEMANRHLAHTLGGAAAPGLPFGPAAAAVARGAAERVQVACLLEKRLLPKLDSGPRSVYETIEVPLTPVLAEMERTGIAVALDRLDGIRADIDARLIEAERRCHELKGRVFNVNSRHEVADALFSDGSFTPTKKVKDGWSTDASVLEKFADGTNLPSAILAYRQLQKLKGTYVDKLPAYVAVDGRIHTHFNQAVAATGRLSSDEPNLQNIPIRTFEGRRIRDCFVPAAGHAFVSADYSQIELRILAHYTEEPALVDSFRGDVDIHRRTASEVFGVPLDRVTFEQRSAAKAINFGLLYGMSSFRLSNELQISRGEAERYMNEYFARLPRVITWIEAAKAEAHRQGWVETLFGRRRLLPAIHSPNFSERSAAEREAVNTRIQGTAADIIKLAMLRVHRVLRESYPSTRLLLQVHDELLLEVPLDEVEAVRARVAAEMSAAAHLIVPLRVNTAVGSTWNEAHG
jgi:DNA polymerase-1